LRHFSGLRGRISTAAPATELASSALPPTVQGNERLAQRFVTAHAHLLERVWQSNTPTTGRSGGQGKVRAGLSPLNPGDILAPQANAPEMSVERAADSASEGREEEVTEFGLHVDCVPEQLHNVTRG